MKLAASEPRATRASWPRGRDRRRPPRGNVAPIRSFVDARYKLSRKAGDLLIHLCCRRASLPRCGLYGLRGGAASLAARSRSHQKSEARCASKRPSAALVHGSGRRDRVIYETAKSFPTAPSSAPDGWDNYANSAHEPRRRPCAARLKIWRARRLPSFLGATRRHRATALTTCSRSQIGGQEGLTPRSRFYLSTPRRVGTRARPWASAPSRSRPSRMPKTGSHSTRTSRSTRRRISARSKRGGKSCTRRCLNWARASS